MVVVIHPGMHNAGASTLQSGLSNFDDGHTRYMGFDDPNHSIALTTMFGADPQDHVAHRRLGRTAEQVADLAVQDRAVLAADLALPHKTLVMSGEEISYLSKSAIHDLREIIQSAGREVSVIAYIRDPFGFAASEGQELIRRGSPKLSPVRPNYKRQFEKFGDLFGPDQVQFVSCADLATAGSTVPEDFAQRLGLSNAGLEFEAGKPLGSQVAVELMLVLNRSGIELRGSKPRNKARNTVFRLLRLGFDGPEFRFPKSTIDPVLDRNDIAWMEDVAGFDLSSGVNYPVAEDPMPVSAIFERLKSMLANFQCEIPRQSSIPDLLVLLYQCQLELTSQQFAKTGLEAAAN